MIFGILGNTEKPELLTVSRDLLRFLHDQRLSFLVHYALASWLREHSVQIDEHQVCPEVDLHRKCDVIIALGGDGTMLTAARIVGSSEVPILGVNLGKLGFLAEVSISELEEAIREVVKGEYAIEKRTTLMATSEVDGKQLVALNEVVVDKGSSARMIEMETYVDEDYLGTYAADGLIIATPTGSTAYSMASGGPIISPGSNVLVLTPVSPHSLTSRPIVLPDQKTIRVVVHSASRKVHITADGQLEEFYEAPTSFRIQRGSNCIRLIKRRKRTYYEVLRAKLLWGKDVRLSEKRQHGKN